MNPLIIKVDEEDTAKLQSLNIELEATAEIIATYINTSNEASEVEAESFKGYHEVYQKRCRDFEDAKRELENKYISDEIRSIMDKWDLDYQTSELKINFKEKE